MGSSRPRNSTRARKARSTKRSPRPPSATHRPRTKHRSRVPIAIELAIDEQRDSIEFSISLLYCLHSALRRRIEDAGHIEPAAVTQAARSADLTDISGMLLVKLAAIHAALDPTELEDSKVDQGTMRLTQNARELHSTDESGG